MKEIILCVAVLVICLAVLLAVVVFAIDVVKSWREDEGSDPSGGHLWKR